jgi:D-amino-acid oxidase
VGGSCLQILISHRYPNPRPDVTRQILSRVLELVPEIVPPRLRANPNGPPQVEDALPLVIDEGCGLRPARHGGIRLAVDWVSAGPESTTTKKVPVIYNYG